MRLPELRRLLGASEPHEFTILDVRSAESFAEGHFTGSVSMPLTDLPERYTELRLNDTVVCVGGGGAVADAAACFLIAKNFWSVASLHNTTTQ
jgi:rhodanese-related sulfurtransferase